MSAHVLLNLLSELGAKIRCEAHWFSPTSFSQMQDVTYYVCMYVTKIAFY